jgi:Fe2+ or Zn2+ uptake regulation protein
MRDDERLRAIRASGFRLTKARRTLFDVLKEEARPRTAPEIAALMKKRGTSADKTTVYRELAFLLARGLVQAVQFGDRQKRYELRSGHHHHLVCTSCGVVIDVALKGDLDAIERRLARKTGFRIDDHALEFFGLCAECR